MPDFREGQVENRAKTGKCSISQGFEGGFLQFALNGKSTHRFTILIQNT